MLRNLRLLDYPAFAALLLLYGIGLALMLSGQTSAWVDLIYDDGYYYLGIVRSLVESGASSFLPPFETNGYQPLWVGVLTVSALVFGTSDLSLALQLYTLSFLFVFAFAMLCRRAVGVAFPAIAAAAIFPKVTISGMETTMMPLFVLAFFLSPGWKSRGAFASLVFLTRLDALALVVARDACALVFRGQKDFRHYRVLFPVVIGYFALNQWIFGTPVPVSGLAKSVGSVFGENLSVIYLYLANLKLPALILLVVAFAQWLVSRKVEFRFGDEILALLGAQVVICGYYAFRSGWIVWPWYYWPAMLLLFYALLEATWFIIGVLEFRVVRWRPPAVVAGMIVMVVSLYALQPAVTYSERLLLRYLDRDSPRETYAIQNLELVAFIRQELPQNSFIAMGDRAGSFGFFLGEQYRFLHTEGLVGPYRYYEALEEDEGASFLEREGVEYLIADRDQYFRHDNIIGVAEPVQPMSSRYGSYLICLPREAVLFEDSYRRNGAQSQRYLFNLSQKEPCPESMKDQFLSMRARYGALRQFSLVSEYLKEGRSGVFAWLDDIVPLPPGW